MVFAIPSPERDILHAYLITDLSKEQLNKIHEDFEYGSQARIEPCMRLHIHDFRQHRNKTHAEIRKLVTAHQAGDDDPIDDDKPEVVDGEAEDDDDDDDEEGGEWEDEPEPQDFLLIDDLYANEGAIWYVQDFATQEEVDEKEAVSTDTLWEIFMLPMEAPSTKQNYEIANMTIVEDLDNCGVKLPFKNGTQNKVWSLGKEHHKGMFDTLQVNVLAEPGEWEDSTKEEDRKTLFPMPALVSRLKDDVAKEVGVISGWVTPNEPKWFAGLEGKKIKKGSVVLSQHVNLDVERPPYKRIPESL